MKKAICTGSSTAVVDSTACWVLSVAPHAERQRNEARGSARRVRRWGMGFPFAGRRGKRRASHCGACKMGLLRDHRIEHRVSLVLNLLPPQRRQADDRRLDGTSSLMHRAFEGRPLTSTARIGFSP